MERICDFYARLHGPNFACSSVLVDNAEIFMRYIKTSFKPEYELKLYQIAQNNKELYIVDREQASKIDRDFIGKCIEMVKSHLEKKINHLQVDSSFYEDHLFDYLFFLRALSRQGLVSIKEVDVEPMHEEGPITEEELHATEKILGDSAEFMTKLNKKSIVKLEEVFKKDSRDNTGLKHFVYSQYFEDEIRKESRIKARFELKMYGLIGLVAVISVNYFSRYPLKTPFWNT